MSEIWKPLTIDDHETGYTISSHGSVQDENKKLFKFYNERGWYNFYFKKNGKLKQLKVHRLVAMNFIDNPMKFKYVQHVDGNRHNNHVNNLKWAFSKTKKIVDESSLNDAIWRPIYINGEVTNYSVSVKGDIRVADTLQLLSLSSCVGYASCTIGHKDKRYKKLAHRLVAEAFIPNDDEKKYVNHINYNRMDNRVENLEWVTASENTKHARLKADRNSYRVPVIRWNLDGTEPVYYDSCKQAEDEVGSGVHHCVTGRLKTARGYIWTYANAREKIEIDLNEFKPVENHPKFLISIDGRIYSLSHKKIKTHMPTDSYMRVNLDKKSYYIHKLIAIHFIDKPENYNDKWIVNHKDGNKLNNSIGNLEWMSASDNTRHVYDNGLSKSATPIVQKDSGGNIVGEYPSISHASRAFKCKRYHILNPCKNKDKCVVCSFKWQFKRC